MIVSRQAFELFTTFMVAAICIGWGARDVYLLATHWKKRDEWHDQIFGSIIGIAMVTLGMLGIFKYYGYWSFRSIGF